MQKIAAGLLMGMLATAGSAFAQDPSGGGGGGADVPFNKYLEYNYDKMSIKERKALPYPSLREADVLYAQRIVRMIDTREKKNLPLQWPKNPLNKLMYEMTTVGEDGNPGQLKAYKNDSLTSVYMVDEVKKMGAIEETVQVQVDPNDPYYLVDSTVYTPFDYVSIRKYMIGEEWIFDKQRSQFFPRIDWIAPVYKPLLGGIELPEQPMFFVSWNELRNVLVNEEIFNRKNDAMRLSYNDYFEMRLFSSYIIRESNEFDLAISDMPEFKDNPMEALYESERIKEELFNWEHDLWEY